MSDCSCSSCQSHGFQYCHCEKPDTWDDVDTTSETPVADELREFADEVARAERQLSGDIEVYFTGDTQRINIEYGDGYDD